MRVRFLAHVEVPSFGRCFDLLDLCFFVPLNDGRLRGSGDPISEYPLFCPMVTIMARERIMKREGGGIAKRMFK